MNIRAFSFQKMNQDLNGKLEKIFSEFLSSEYYVLGKKTEEFEKKYADYSQTKFCAGVANGLDALYISLKILGIKEGDEVIVPSNTYIATWLAISMCGAKIVPVEPDEKTYNLSPSKIVSSITSKTKVILPVHLYGQICDMNAISKIAEDHNLHIIEDNAQSQGSKQNNCLAGSFGILNATSFYPTKNLGAYGDGGAITTNDEELYNKIKCFRNYGSKVKYENEVIGINSRLDELQAAFLIEKLNLLNKWNTERQSIAKIYNNELKEVSCIILPYILTDTESVYHQYVIRSERRNELQDYLNSNGIMTNIHYPIPPHLQKAYLHLGFKKGDYPIAEKISKEVLSLPIYPGLSENEIAFIIEKIKKFN